jgi:voltage-gated sodium channel
MKFNCDSSILSDGEIALDTIFRNRFDVIFVDLLNPLGIDGIELAKRLREIEKSLNKTRLKIIGLAPGDSPDLRLRALEYMDDVFAKPLTLRQSEFRKIFGPSSKSFLSIDSVHLSDTEKPTLAERFVPVLVQDLYRRFKEFKENRKQLKREKQFASSMTVALGKDVPKECIIPNSYVDVVPWLYARLSDFCRHFAYSELFTNFMTFVIILAGANIGAQTDPRTSKNLALMNALDVLDYFILYTFLSEVILKIIAEKFRPYRYFKDPWNIFDCIIVIGSMIPGSGSLLILLRLLRLLRIVKMIKAFPQLAVLVSALISGLASIGYVGVILGLTFYVFAIVGVILFQNSDPWHFGTLHMALITLFRSATLDNWYEVLMISIVGCDQGVDVYSFAPEQCVSPAKLGSWAIPYTLTFLVIASQVLLVLFIGVISTSMDEAREARNKTVKVEAELLALRKERGISQKQVNSFQKIFNTIDIEKDGLLAPDEVEMALGALNLDVDATEMRALYMKVDPTMSGIGCADFIRLVLMTPKYIQGAALKHMSHIFARAQKPKKLGAFYNWAQKSVFGIFTEDDDDDIITREYHAAVMVQRVWRGKMKRRQVANMKAAAAASRSSKSITSLIL